MQGAVMTEPYTTLPVDMLQIRPGVAVLHARLTSAHNWYTSREFDASTGHDGYQGPLRVFTLQDWMTRSDLDEMFAATGTNHAHPWLLAALAVHHIGECMPAAGEPVRVTFALGLAVPGEAPATVLLANLWTQYSASSTSSPFRTRLGLLEASPGFEFRPGDRIIGLPVQ